MPDRLLRPSDPERTRILYLARHAPDEVAAPPSGLAASALPGYASYHANLRHDMIALGYDVRSSSNPLAVTAAAGTVDLVVSLLNRMPMRNPEIFVPSLCASLHLRCLGAPANIRALAEDKFLSKLAFRSLGLPVAPGCVYRRGESLAAPDFAGPYFVKDRFGAASEGIEPDSLQECWADAARIVARLHGQDREVLVERYCPGIYVTVPVLGDAPFRVLGFVSPQSDKAGAILTADLKIDDRLGNRLVDVGESATAMHTDVSALWQGLGPIDYFRLDYRWDPETGRRWALEINICCYLGRHGAIGLAGKQWGYERRDILAHVIEHSLNRQSPQSGSPPHLQRLAPGDGKAGSAAPRVMPGSSPFP